MTFSHRRRIAVLAALAAVAGVFAFACANAADRPPLRVLLPVSAGSGVDTIVRAAAPALGKALGDQSVIIENLSGRRRHHRHAGIGQGRARRQHDRGRVEQPRRQPERLQEDAVRQPGRHHADHGGRRDALRARRQPEEPAGDERDPAGRAAQGQAGRLQLRFVGQRHHHPPRRRDVRRRGRRRGEAHSLQGRRTDAGRPGRRPGRLRRRRRSRSAGLPEERVAARHRHHGQVARAVVARSADDRRAGPSRRRHRRLVRRDRPGQAPGGETKRLHDAVVAAFASPEVRAAMARQDNIIAPTTPEAAAQYFRTEQDRYARLVKKANITLD